MNLDAYKNIIAELKSSNAQLIAVSKTKPLADIQTLYNEGQRIFGENKVQEMCDKKELLPADIQWHLIGHLQTNKVKFIAPFVAMIHSVDSMKLLSEINKQAAKSNRVVDCLLQIHIAAEETKFGFNSEELFNVLRSQEFKLLKNVRICGLMGMATNTDDEQKISKEFEGLKALFNEVKSMFFQNSEYFKELSIGMSSDYKIALKHGATFVRIGSTIFGER
jgi:pyridoxal phosphate enzyme (YggS family)